MAETANKRVKIIGADYCPYCQNAKKYFQNIKEPFEWVDSEQHPEARELLKTQYNWQTIPGVFVDGKFIGGYTDTMEAINKGKITFPRPAQ